MTIVHHNIDDPTAGAWVRLIRGGGTVSICRFLGHLEVIHTSDSGRFEFDHVEPDAEGGPEAVYTYLAV